MGDHAGKTDEKDIKQRTHENQRAVNALTHTHTPCRRENDSRVTGYRRSKISGSVIRVFVMCV